MEDLEENPLWRLLRKNKKLYRDAAAARWTILVPAAATLPATLSRADVEVHVLKPSPIFDAEWLPVAGATAVDLSKPVRSGAPLPSPRRADADSAPGRHRHHVGIRRGP